ncbi:MAG: creatininase family protein, partial [Paracoccaceae bacterium]
MTRQLELLRPDQIADEMARCPRVWLPLGTIEYHSHHLPVGLDGLQAHGLCLDAADLAGGLVYPPLWWGTGGGHGAYPWTVMMPDAAEISALLRQTLTRLQAFGVRQAVLFTGHFADEQLDMIAGLAREWNAQNGALQALALGVNGNASAPLPPDHAGRFETTLLAAFWPETVDMALLPPANPSEANEHPFGLQRHAPSHSLHGIFGADPRGFRPEEAAALRRAMAVWLVE